MKEAEVSGERTYVQLHVRAEAGLHAVIEESHQGTPDDPVRHTSDAEDDAQLDEGPR